MTKVDLAREYRDKHGMKVSHSWLARLMLKENPLIFDNAEQARYALRGIEGKLGKNKRLTVTHAAPPRSSNPYQLPDSDEIPFEPYVIKGYKRVAVFSDIHVPYHSISAITTALDFCKKEKPDALLLNGDTLDAFQLSRFIKDPRKRHFADELKMMKQLIEVFQKTLKCKIFFKHGNHEERWEHFLFTKAKELIGIEEFELDNVIKARVNGIDIIKDKRIIHLNGLNVIHGHEYTQGIFNPVNVARGLFLRAKTSAMQAHSHQSSEHTERDMNGKITTTWSTGCLCHDDKTEILTDRGFVLFSELSKSDRVYEFNPSTKELLLMHPKSYQKYWYSGDMYSFTSKRIDQFVTPEHKMLAYRSDGGNRVLSAEKLYGFKRPLALYTTGKVSVRGDDADKLMGELIGFIITDGTYRKESNGVRIYQKTKFDRVKYLLDYFKIKYSVGNSRDIPVFNISAKHGVWLKKMNPVKNLIGRDLLNSNYEFLNGLYEGLIMGDGHRRKDNNKTDYFSTHSQESALQFQELCAKIGYSCIIKKHTGEKTSRKDGYWYMYRCYVRKFDVSDITEKSIEQYTGFVYDITTEHGFFVIRRNGKVSVSGNCELSPAYAPLNKWNWGFAIVDLDGKTGFDVRNKRIYKSSVL